MAKIIILSPDSRAGTCPAPSTHSIVACEVTVPPENDAASAIDAQLRHAHYRYARTAGYRQRALAIEILRHLCTDTVYEINPMDR
ncbi:MAG: hypothetical protein WDN01_00010 [Rhizomicrobium sp.]